MYSNKLQYYISNCVSINLSNFASKSMNILLVTKQIYKKAISLVQ